MSGYANPKWLDIILTTAVPFFFVSSGMLMGKHAETSGNFSSYLWNKSVKFIRLWIIWVLIYLPLDMLFKSPDISMEWMTNWAKHAIIYGEGTWSWPLWFIFSMIIGCLLLSIATSKRLILGTLLVFTLSSILFIFLTLTSPSDLSHYIGILGNRTFPPLIDMRLIRMLLGPICISTGIMISWLRLKPAIIPFVISFAFLLIVMGCVMAYHNITLDILPRSIGLVLIAVLLPQARLNTSSIRQQSMWIYYAHMYCVIILMFFQIHFRIAIEIYQLTAVILCIVVGWMLTKISNTQRFKFLKVLIS